MKADTPEQIHELFAALFNDGDIDGLTELFQSDAVMFPEPGKRVVGVPAIRESLSAYLALDGHFQMSPARVIQSSDTALLFSDWTLSASAQNGDPIELQGQTSDVARRQPDGRWLLVIDSPFGSAGA